MILSSKLLSKQKGIAMIETAIATPFLLFLLFAVAEITNAFTQYNILVKTTQDAARYLASNSTPGNVNLIKLTNDKVLITKNLLVYGVPNTGSAALLQGLQTSMVNVTQFNAEHIMVSVSYPYQSLLGGKIPGFGLFGDINSNFNISAVSVMRAL